MAEKCTTIDYLRKPKVLDMAIFDWVGSLLIAFAVGRWLFHISSVSGWVIFIIVWTMMGVLVHYLVGVNTMFGYYLGLNPKPKRSECQNGV
jgi:uncharacterized membrane protein YcaP (DUF421 family)